MVRQQRLLWLSSRSRSHHSVLVVVVEVVEVVAQSHLHWKDCMSVRMYVCMYLTKYVGSWFGLVGIGVGTSPRECNTVVYLPYCVNSRERECVPSLFACRFLCFFSVFVVSRLFVIVARDNVKANRVHERDWMRRSMPNSTERTGRSSE